MLRLRTRPIRLAQWRKANEGPKVELGPGPDLPIGTEFRLEIPGTVRKNEAFKPVPVEYPDGSIGTAMILSREQKAFRHLVSLKVREAKIPRLTFGAWRIEITAFWPRTRHLDQDFPFGDSDAPITSVMDALDKGAQLFDDDVRIGPVLADRGYDKESPSIEVLLRRWR